MDTLLLNQAYMPISTITWRDAVCLWYKEKVEIVEAYENRMLHSWNFAMQMPAVIRLYHFVKPPKKISRYQPFTRKNVWLRDEGVCQYCGKDLSLREMTFDHVYPRKGTVKGKTNWTNIVCACAPCNNKKRNHTPEQAGMKLIRRPVAPRRTLPTEQELKIRLAKLKYLPHKSWQNYIYWNVELEED